jgi:quercetin dioxygenase-like cupin family protein
MTPKHAFPEALLARLEAFEGGFHAHRLAAQGGDVLFARYAAGEHIPPHEHPTENWGVVLTGALELTCAGETRRYEAGSWYHLAPGQAHEARFPEATTMLELWFYAERGEGTG